MLCTETDLYEPVTTQRSFSFSLKMQMYEGFAITGDISMTQVQQPEILRAHRVRPIQPDAYDDVDADVRPPRSSLRVGRQLAPDTEQLRPDSNYAFTGVIRKALWVVLACLLLFGLGDGLGYPTWQNISNHLRYGDYPTTQIDVQLGHGGISHLTAYTAGDDIVLIEQVGSKLTPYAIKVKTPLEPPRVVSITIADVNLDGRPDVLLHVDGLTQSIIFDNTGAGLSLALAK
jgi:hypothetical protein